MINGIVTCLPCHLLTPTVTLAWSEHLNTPLTFPVHKVRSVGFGGERRPIFFLPHTVPRNRAVIKFSVNASAALSRKSLLQHC